MDQSNFYDTISNLCSKLHACRQTRLRLMTQYNLLIAPEVSDTLATTSSTLPTEAIRMKMNWIEHRLLKSECRINALRRKWNQVSVSEQNECFS
ncbi:unnamed protein product [Dicrocoelium dendriticum]|nr:unnamed protein product [Dicrocoelium dendriticum]